jgi:hypothetical protein
MTSDGSGIRNVRVTLTAPGGQTRSALTGSFGYYGFEGVPVGELILSAYFPNASFSANRRSLLRYWKPSPI